MLQDDEGHGQDAVVGRMLDDGPVLEVDPWRGDVESDIAGEYLDATAVLMRHPVGGRDEDGVRAVFKTEIDGGGDPGSTVSDFGAAEKTIGKAEVLVPPDMIGCVMLQVRAGRDAGGLGPCGYLERVLTGHETCGELGMDVELAYFIAQDAYLSLEVVTDVGPAMFMDGTADEGIIIPLGGVDAIEEEGIGMEALALIHGEGGDTELKFGIESLAESDGRGIADGEHFGGVAREIGVIIGGVVEALVRIFLDVATARVIGLEDMTEGHEGYMLGGGVVDLDFLGERILVMEVAAEVAIGRHGI